MVQYILKEKKYEAGVKLKHVHEKVIFIGVGIKDKELKMLPVKGLNTAA